MHSKPRKSQLTLQTLEPKLYFENKFVDVPPHTICTAFRNAPRQWPPIIKRFLARNADLLCLRSLWHADWTKTDNQNMSNDMIKLT
jgi:hypothetical protein